MTAQARVVVLGDVALDVVVRLLEASAPDSDADARTTLSGGGAGANVAAWLAAAGAAPLLVARVGDDDAGRAQTGALRAAGVALHVAVDRDAPTGTIVVVAAPDGSRTMYADRGANLRLAAADLPDPLGQPGGHVHVSGYALLHPGPRAAARTALARAATAGMTTSVDASSAAPLARAGARSFTSWTAGVDVLRANLDEARVLLGAEVDGPDAATALAARHRVAVVTGGPAGVWGATGATVVHVPAVATTVADTVGAGDATTAGFLATWVADRTDLEAALRAGAALAARAVSRPGGRP